MKPVQKIVPMVLTLLLCAPGLSARAGEAIAYDSAMQEKIFEKTFAKDFGDVVSATAAETAVFSLQDEDIISWEESGKGKYIYFTISDSKNEELAKITQDNLGKPLRLNIGDHFILIPAVTEALHQKNGFVLMVQDEANRAELVHSMLDFAKKAPNTTAIDIGPAVVDVPEVPQPAPAPKQAPAENSGPADSTP